MNAERRIWAVVPVKRFSAAKLRLAPVLSDLERSQLAKTMLADVLGVLTQSADIISEVAVVTADREACDFARRMGATAVMDETENGINAAIARAIKHISPCEGDGMLVVPSDIPQVTHDAFAQAVSAISTSPSVAIAEAPEDGGTNLFACRPIGAVRPRFGPRSFDQHCQAAREAGAALHFLLAPELSLDIDRPRDLKTFLKRASPTHTHALLARINVLDRINKLDKADVEPAIAAAEV